MSIVPPDVMAIRSLKADMRRIIPGNGFFSEVKTVKTPSWSPDNTAMNIGVPTAAVLIWNDLDLSLSEDRRAAGDIRPTLQLLVMGVQKSDDDEALQDLVRMLWADVEKVMLSNLERDWPGSTVTNTWGLGTKQTPGFPAKYRQWGDTNGLYVGGFLSMWWLQIKKPLGG